MPKSKKKIWIVAPFTGNESFSIRNRFNYLANLLHDNEFDVTLFTSNFNHIAKKHVSGDIVNKTPYKVVLIHEPGYKKNVSIGRACSHMLFSKNLKDKIYTMSKPALILAAYPTMSAAYVAGKYAEKHKIPFVIDVQDTWPESISAAINTDKLYVRMLMYPFTRFANTIYKKAIYVFGVSETYANRANIKGSKSKGFTSIYIGAEGNKFKDIKLDADAISKPDNEIWITYIGTLSHSYDIETAIRAFSKLRSLGNIKFQILGDGPHKDQLVKIAKELDVFDKNVIFRGFMKYETMIEFLKKSDIALNALTGGSKGSITNKFGDYVSAGLPMLNSCQVEEVLNLVVEKELGLNYQPGDVESLEKAIMLILSDKEKLKEYSANAIRFAEEKFDRKNSYKAFLSTIRELIN